MYFSNEMSIVSMNSYFSLTGDPGRSTRRLLSGTHSPSAPRGADVRPRAAAPGRSPTTTPPHRLVAPILVHPVPQGRFTNTELTRDLRDRPRRVDHQLHRVLTKLRREHPLTSNHFPIPSSQWINLTPVSYTH